MVRLVFRPKTEVGPICTQVSPRASTRVSPDFALLGLRSPSFKAKHSFFKHFQDHWRLQVHSSKHSLSLRLLHTQTHKHTRTDTVTETETDTRTDTRTQTRLQKRRAREPAGNASGPVLVRCVMRSRALLWNVFCPVYVSASGVLCRASACATSHLLHVLPCRVAAGYATPAS